MDTSTNFKKGFFVFFSSEKMCFGGPGLKCPFLCVNNYHLREIKIKWKYLFAAYFFHPYTTWSLQVHLSTEKENGGGRFHMITVHIQVQAYMNIVFPECIYMYIMYRYVCIMYIAIV